MQILKMLHSRKIAKSINIKKKLIQSTFIFTVFIIALNFILFYIPTRNTFEAQMTASSVSLVQQIATSHEIVLKYIKDAINKTTLYDNDLNTLAQSYTGTLDDKMTIKSKLNSLVVFNSFIHSAYIYFPDKDQVFSSILSEAVLPFKEFPDKEAFSKTDKSYLYTLDPRLVNLGKDNALDISVVTALPMGSWNKSAYLVVNIDARKLYTDSFKKLDSNQKNNLYIYNEEGQLIMCRDESLLFTKASLPSWHSKLIYSGLSSKLLLSNTVIASVYTSEALKWTYVLETTVNTANNLGSKLFFYISFSILLVVVSLLLIITFASFFTKPISGMMEKYDDHLWKGFLLDTIFYNPEVEKMLQNDNFETADSKYAVMVLQINQEDLTEKELSELIISIREFKANSGSDTCYRLKIMETSKNLISIIACFPESHGDEHCVNLLQELASWVQVNMNPFYRNITYIGISSIKSHVQLLPAAYKECLEMFNYKLNFDSRIIFYAAVRKPDSQYEYPAFIERHLINNLLVGNQSGCDLFIHEFFQTFANDNFKFDDNTIKNSVFQLQNAVLKSTIGLPISIALDCDINIINLHKTSEIQSKFLVFIHEICSEVNRRRETSDEHRLFNMILEYIETHFFKDDFCLNKISEDLHVNKSYLSKIVKEKTGEGFNEYINKRRITMAKELLPDKQKSIEDISKEVGFNYSYYFIKVFKSVEGVTPGQYRSRLS